MSLTRSPAATFLNLILMVSSLIMLCNAYGGMVGAKSEVEDVKTNQEVQRLGKFSIQEYNKRNHDSDNNNTGNGELMFMTVVEAKKQVVSGIKYYLKIVALTRSGETKIFDSIVVVKPWIKSKQLVHFGLSSGQPVLF